MIRKKDVKVTDFVKKVGEESYIVRTDILGKSYIINASVFKHIVESSKVNGVLVSQTLKLNS